MQLHPTCHESVWPFWQKVLFRFCFIFFGLYILPFDWLGALPVLKYVAEWQDALFEAIVKFANAHFYHLKKDLVMPNGSGDTSYGWAQLLTFTWLGIIGSIIWTVLDRKRQNYAWLNYLLCIGIRYFVAYVALIYGIEKIFALQMPFPNTSQLATNLGDFLPMRFSWMFIGYSLPYQVFSGVMETVVGLLLLNKRTATFGSVMAFVVFTNVMMLNLSYDIPVKIFSMELTALSFFLLMQEHRRIVAFFLLNKEAASCSIYVASFSRKWVRISRGVLKCFFVLLAITIIYDTYGYYKQVHTNGVFTKPFQQGLYDIVYQNHATDTIASWQNIAFDTEKSGSIKTEDSVLRRRYGRSYFAYKLDTLNHIIHFNKLADDSISAFNFQYSSSKNNGILLKATIGSNDSIVMQLNPSRHHFQLAEKQFHWLSEANR